MRVPSAYPAAWRVFIDEDDALYGAAHRWVIGALPQESQRAIAVTTTRRSATDIAIIRRISGAASVDCDGHRITARVLRYRWQWPRLTHAGAAGLEFTARTPGGLTALHRQLEELAKQPRPVGRTRAYFFSAESGWASTTLHARPLSSVVLADGVVDRVLADLRRFCAAEETYNRRGIPWHRGYLFHGPPGTGKTSIARALATELNMDLYVLPMSAVTDDGDIPRIISFVDPGSILLLEDIDTAAAARDRDSDGPGMSMSGLLNALDGVATPHGLVTVMTSNRREVLDPAVIRPGRVDVTEFIGLPDTDQATRLFTKFYDGTAPSAPIDPAGRTTAELVEVFKQHLDTPGLAELALTTNTKGDTTDG